MSKLRSVMTHNFSKVPKANIQRSSFNRSHGLKTTFNSGYLVPIFIDEALPGDSFNLSMTGFARMATPIFPVMDNMYMETFFFSVPMRLVWDNFQKFMGERENPDDDNDYLIPQKTVTGGIPNLSLADYFGLPTLVNSVTFSELPFRAYNLIWNEWFRDENFQDSLQVNKTDTPYDGASGTYGSWVLGYGLQYRGKRYDYFTSCLPWPQKGESVDLPLGTTAPVSGIGTQAGETAETGPFNVKETDLASPGYRAYDYYINTETSLKGIIMEMEGSAGTDRPLIYADLSAATGATINQLREAFAVQKLLERDARGGSRYTEIIRSHFGVTSPDARLQRPEFLGGGSSPINVTPIAQTSSTDATSPQGNLAAMGTATLRGHGFTKSFTEHSIIIGLINVRADLTYQQGLERMWSRTTRYDFYWPALSTIGEQEVLNKELYYQGTSEDDEVFGYNERYAEYRYKPSKVTGQFRSNDAVTLDSWHLCQDFGSKPTLGNIFILDEPPIERVVAFEDAPQFIFDSYFKYHCARPMPLYGVPGNIDRF